VRQDTLQGYIDDWLEAAGVTVQEAAAGDERAILAPLHSERDAARRGLGEAREAIEAWLVETLRGLIDPEPLPDGRVRYELGDWCVELPGAGLSELWEIYSWASSATGVRDHRRLQELEAEHDALASALVRSPTEMMRDKIGRRALEVEAEMGRLRGQGGPADEVPGLRRQLEYTARQLTTARRELAAGSPRRRAKALSDVIERIEVTHRPERLSPTNPTVVHRLASVRIIPRLGPGSSDGSTQAAACHTGAGCGTRGRPASPGPASRVPDPPRGGRRSPCPRTAPSRA
jgi:hypothetical protein